MYVAHVLDLPPRTAAAAFEALRAEHSTLVAGPFTLRLRRARAADERDGERRAMTGTITGGWSLPVPVEVEVTPWSSTRSEIGIRPRGRFVPLDPGYRHGRYLSAAVQLAAVLGDRLERCVCRGMSTSLASTGPATVSGGVDTRPRRVFIDDSPVSA